MNSIVRLALAATLAASVYPASATTFKVTDREAGIETAAAPVVPPAAAPKEAAPAATEGTTGQFVIVATISVAEQPVMQMRYKGHDAFDDEDSCKAFVASDDELKKSNDGLAALAKVKLHPDAKVDVSCEPVE